MLKLYLKLSFISFKNKFQQNLAWNKSYASAQSGNPDQSWTFSFLHFMPLILFLTLNISCHLSDFGNICNMMLQGYMTLFRVLTRFKKTTCKTLGFIEIRLMIFFLLFFFCGWVGGVGWNRTIFIPWHFSLDFNQACFILILMNE